jgi:ferredoxin
LLQGEDRLMPQITVEGETTFEADAGKKLVLCLEDAGIDILHRCGGNARCTTCRVEIVSGTAPPMSEKERAALSREPGLLDTYRLSCQIRVESDLTVRVAKRAHVEGLRPGPRPAP